MAYNNRFVLSENLKLVRERIARAARGAGRDPSEVALVCVSKGIPPERIREAAACGVLEIGENRVQEAQEKQLVLGTVPAGDCPRITWHLIGHLQRNKARLAVQLFDVVHSVDSLELIEALERQAALRRAVRPELVSKDERLAQGERRLEVLLQVNVSGEATRHGCRPDQTAALAEALLRAGHLRFAGLMTMAPYTQDPEDARPVFRQLRELRSDLEKRFFQSTINNRKSTLHLSMGMSHDFEVAVQEGATIVRIGAAIFGERIAGSV